MPAMSTTPIAAAEAMIAADRACADPAIWISRRNDADLRAEAERLTAEGARGRPLWGLTVAIKDNIDVTGLPTTAGRWALPRVSCRGSGTRDITEFGGWRAWLAAKETTT